LAAGDVRICTRIPHPQLESLNRIVEKIKAEKIKAAGGKSIAVQGSVTSSREIDCFFNQTEKQLGKVAVLFNNAGVFAYGGGRKIRLVHGRPQPTHEEFRGHGERPPRGKRFRAKPISTCDTG
jgi:NAD(P)-dependent dehydrogenase (short-subunit alcohol dehydrogenase family)